MMCRFIALAASAVCVAPAVAQPVVPDGFTARQIAPALDGQVPKISATTGSMFPPGVIATTVSETTDIVTFYVIEPSGTIAVLSSFIEPHAFLVLRTRVDFSSLFDGHVHATIGLDPVDSSGLPQRTRRTSYVTIDLQGNQVRQFEAGENTDRTGYDFAFQAGSPSGAVLLDINGTHGTKLATLSPNFGLNVVNPDSLPKGRTDTDAQGFVIDPTGLYGGEALVADSDDGQELSVIYSLTNISSGGAYSEISSPVNWNTRRYGDIDIVGQGPFGGVLYITEQISDEIQQVAPDGTHTTWATGFVGIDSLSISPDGESMYVADLNGVWLIRPEGNEPGPAVLAQDPSTTTASPQTGAPVSSLRVIFTEPVSFVDADVTITDNDGQSVAFDASGSGSQFMIIGLATPLESDTYTVTLSDTITGVGTGQSLDGDNDGIAGGDAVLSFAHACAPDLNNDGELDFLDISAFVQGFGTGCP